MAGRQSPDMANHWRHLCLSFFSTGTILISLGCQCSELSSTRWSPGSHKGNASEMITDAMLGHNPYLCSIEEHIKHQDLEDTYFSGNTKGSTVKHFLSPHLVHFSRLLKSCRHFSLHSDRLANLTAKIWEGLHIWTHYHHKSTTINKGSTRANSD